MRHDIWHSYIARISSTSRYVIYGNVRQIKRKYLIKYYQGHSKETIWKSRVFTDNHDFKIEQTGNNIPS
jgi:hypothetical protein